MENGVLNGTPNGSNGGFSNGSTNGDCNGTNGHNGRCPNLQMVSRDLLVPPKTRRRKEEMSDTRQSLMLNQEQLAELTNVFETIDADGNGYINVTELGEALEVCGFRLPGYKIRDLIAEFDSKIRDDKLDIEEFRALYLRLRGEEFGAGLKKLVSKRNDVTNFEGTSSASAAGTTHSFSIEELVAFSNWINRYMKQQEQQEEEAAYFLI